MTRIEQEAERLARECAEAIFNTNVCKLHFSVSSEQSKSDRQAIVASILGVLNLPQLIADRDEAGRLRKELGEMGSLERQLLNKINEVSAMRTERDAIRAERDELRKERNELRNFIWKETGCGEHTSLGEGLNRCKEKFEEIHKLRTREAALVALVEQLRRYYLQSDDKPWPTIEQALSNFAKAGVEVK